MEQIGKRVTRNRPTTRTTILEKTNDIRKKNCNS